MNEFYLLTIINKIDIFIVLYLARNGTKCLLLFNNTYNILLHRTHIQFIIALNIPQFINAIHLISMTL